MAFEEGAGVLEVLFGVGPGGGDARKGFVEEGHDPLLFGERGDGEFDSLDIALVDRGENGAFCSTNFILFGEKYVEKETPFDFRSTPYRSQATTNTALLRRKIYWADWCPHRHE